MTLQLDGYIQSGRFKSIVAMQSMVSVMVMQAICYVRESYFLIDSTQDHDNGPTLGVVGDIVPASHRTLQGSLVQPPVTSIEHVETCPECPGPSSAYFIGNFSSLLQQEIGNATISSIRSLGGEPIELESVDCATTLDEFDSNVFVDFLLGNTTAQPTPDEIRALEQAFLVSYNTLNGLNSETCDTLFREVVDVRLEDLNISYTNGLEDVQEEDVGCTNNTNASFTAIPCNTTNNTSTEHVPAELQRHFPFLFRVRGTCRGCRRDRNLFDEGTRRRVLTSFPMLPLPRKGGWGSRDETNRMRYERTDPC